MLGRGGGAKGKGVPGPLFFTFLFLHPSLSTKFGQKVNHEIILEITGVIDSSQGYLKTYKLIKAFFI